MFIKTIDSVDEGLNIFWSDNTCYHSTINCAKTWANLSVEIVIYRVICVPTNPPIVLVIGS